MARKGCKCRDGSYRVKCCTSTKRENKSVTINRGQRSNKTRSPVMSGPMSPMEYASRRREQAFVHVLLTPQGRKAIAYGGMQAERAYTKVLGRKAGQKASLALYAGAKVGGRFVPIVGWVILAHDTYRLTKWLHGKMQG